VLSPAKIWKLTVVTLLGCHCVARRCLPLKATAVIAVFSPAAAIQAALAALQRQHGQQHLLLLLRLPRRLRHPPRPPRQITLQDRLPAVVPTFSDQI